MEGIDLVANLMVIAATTAPKSRGENFVQTKVLNVNNRIIYRIGVVAREMNPVDWDNVMGIPLSVTGKSIYFDR